MKQDYLAEAQQFKSAGVGLYGVGVQCHFGNEMEPDAAVIKVESTVFICGGIEGGVDGRGGRWFLHSS